MTELHAWLPQVIAIARQAGDAIMEVYGGDIEVQRNASKPSCISPDDGPWISKGWAISW